MKRFLALCPLLAVTACSAGGTAVTSVPSGASLQSVAVQHPLVGPSATLLAPQGAKLSRIYVAQFQGFDVEEFDPTGKLLATSPSIDGPQNIVFDKAGNLFVADFGSNEILSFTKDLKQNSTVISLPDDPVGLAVGANNGKLFATLYRSGTVVAYDQNGQQTTPTITGSGNVTYVAVDSHGKIYVTDSALNTLKTYKSDGTPTKPTITAGLDGPGDVVVDKAGKIYVANGAGSGSITTYNPDGSRAKPTIAVKAPHGLTVGVNGDIYVTDSTDMTALTFSPKGTPIRPTITGLNSPTGIAVLDLP